MAGAVASGPLNTATLWGRLASWLEKWSVTWGDEAVSVRLVSTNLIPEAVSETFSVFAPAASVALGPRSPNATAATTPTATTAPAAPTRNGRTTGRFLTRRPYATRAAPTRMFRDIRLEMATASSFPTASRILEKLHTRIPPSTTAISG